MVTQPKPDTESPGETTDSTAALRYGSTLGVGAIIAFRGPGKRTESWR